MNKETIKAIARPFAIYALAAACAWACVAHPSVEMQGVTVAGLLGLAGARTCDKIWGKQA